MNRELWIPGAAAPSLDDLVVRVHRVVEDFARSRGIERPHVEVLLHDGTQLAVHSMKPEPGYGYLTICPHPDDASPEDESLPPVELIVPVGSIIRVRLSKAPEHEPSFGFSVPDGGAGQ